jgi:hypothetical protein
MLAIDYRQGRRRGLLRVLGRTVLCCAYKSAMAANRRAPAAFSSRAARAIASIIPAAMAGSPFESNILANLLRVSDKWRSCDRSPSDVLSEAR